MATSNYTVGSGSVARHGLPTERVLENEETRIHHRLFQITLVPSLKPLMYIVTQMVRGKNPNENLIDYFDRINPKNVKFNKTHKETILSDPSCLSYDITLCFKIIQEYCDKVKEKNDLVWTTPGDTLEYYITEIKNKRNDFIHKVYRGDMAKFEQIVREMKRLLRKTWEKIAQTFRTDTSMDILAMEADITKITAAPFEDIRVYLSELQATMITDGVASMKENYVNNLSYVPDVHLLNKNLGARSKIKVLKVFTEMQIVYEEGRKNITMDEWFIELENIHDRQSKQSRFLLVEGMAGVGKSTLIRKLVLDWASGSSTIIDLGDFELLIYMQFREKHINSMSLLCTSVLPFMRGKVDPEYLMMLTEGSNIIFVCDGLDENNSQSIQLFKEILDYGTKIPLTVVCTTRPNEIGNLLLMLPAQFSYLRLQVLGIHDTNRPAFIKRYLEAQNPGIDPQSLLDYLNRVSTRMQEHLRFPYNLTCLVMLWILNPGMINSLTTATELFMVTHNETEKKLKTRQLEKGAELSEISENIDSIMNTLYEIALIHHGSGDIILTEDSLQSLKNECSWLKLAWGEISSTFFTQHISWLDNKESSYSFPHNGLQDFYAAMSILKKVEDHIPDKKKTITDVRRALTRNHCSVDQIRFVLGKVDEVLDSPMSTRSLGSVFQEIAREASPDIRTDKLIRRSQNILTHLTGILHYRGKAFTEERAQELFLLLEESGIQDTEQWLDLLELTKCDETLCKLIAQRFPVGKSIKVTDSRTVAYTSLLPHINKKKVNIYIHIECEPKQVLHLEKLLHCVEEKQWMLRLVLYHEFRQPKPGGSSLDGALKQLRCSMFRFQGQMSLTLLETLPSALQDLRLSVANSDQYLALSLYMSAVKSRLPLLATFRLHIPAHVVDTELLQPLPEGLKLELIISKVDSDTVEWACRAASALQPKESRYCFLSLLGVGNSTLVCHRLLEALVRDGVQMAKDALLVVSPKLAMKDASQMKKSFMARLGCRFRSWREDAIWTYS
ncbi:uncharacterized protein LOC125035022 [Penaeus chinensis]|uniref:uncharacterized protein LOC125035022 n=1 Tax=Penaeus chinensis TaxID=139456 RepID=UPI001FB78DFB|nr:uncharacterized protein LOC125035022 [Penaeus chinensis]